MTHIADVRRWVALRAHGTLRIFDHIQGGVEDIEGAIDAGQFTVAAFMARNVVLTCLSISSLASAGGIEFDEESVSYDYFAGLENDEIAAALNLANEALEIDEGTANTWLERFRVYVDETEQLLGFDRELPLFRSPEGALGLLGLTRRWGPLLEELDLPTLLHSNWIPGEADED